MLAGPGTATRIKISAMPVKLHHCFKGLSLITVSLLAGQQVQNMGNLTAGLTDPFISPVGFFGGHSRRVIPKRVMSSLHQNTLPPFSRDATAMYLEESEQALLKSSPPFSRCSATAMQPEKSR